MRPWILPHFFGQISNDLPMAGVSKYDRVYFKWYSRDKRSIKPSFLQNLSNVCYTRAFPHVFSQSIKFESVYFFGQSKPKYSRKEQESVRAVKSLDRKVLASRGTRLEFLSVSEFGRATTLLRRAVLLSICYLNLE